MKFKQLEVSAFGGINPSSPVVLDFTQSNWITLSGDKGVGKTSLIHALLVACGQIGHTGEGGKKFVNLDSGTIDLNFSFTEGRREYSVRATKSQLKVVYDDVVQEEPMALLKRLIGTVGVSPMTIKNAPLKEVVKWLASYTKKSPEEYETNMRKLKDAIKQAENSRADANRTLKGLNEYLDNEPMAKPETWEENEKLFNTPVDTAALKEQRDYAEGMDMKYDLAKSKRERFVERKLQIEEAIAKLVAEAETVNLKLAEADKWLEEHKHVPDEYARAKYEFDTAADKAMQYSKWQEIKKKKAERDEFETVSQKFDAIAKEKQQKVKELQTEILPDIKGVEIIDEDTHVDGKPVKEGLYWNGRNIAQMSETEWWDIVLQIWKKYKVPAIVIDNFQNLGSTAVALLEKLAKQGVYVLTAEMDRQQKTLQIEYDGSKEV